MGSRFGINDNVIENNSKITKDPKIAKDPTFKKRNPTQNPETQPENFSNLSGRSKIHSSGCVLLGWVAGDSNPI